MPRPHDHALVGRLRKAAARAPIAVAHRGDSRNHPENTLPAFAAAVALGVGMIEFDVQELGDGTLVCLHDDTADRTTDAAEALGPARPLGKLALADLRGLHIRDRHGRTLPQVRVPTLAEGLAVIHPGAVPMIEHKSGQAASYVALLRELGLLGHVVLQSFDWQFVAEVQALAPEVALGLLGPHERAPAFTGDVLAAIAASGASLVHWDEAELRLEDLRALQALGLLVCTYTTDDDLGLIGAGAMGLDAITTNVPGRLLSLVRAGACRRPPRG